MRHHGCRGEGYRLCTGAWACAFGNDRRHGIIMPPCKPLLGLLVYAVPGACGAESLKHFRANACCRLKVQL